LAQQLPAWPHRGDVTPGRQALCRPSAKSAGRFPLDHGELVQEDACWSLLSSIHVLKSLLASKIQIFALLLGWKHKQNN